MSMISLETHQFDLLMVRNTNLTVVQIAYTAVMFSDRTQYLAKSNEVGWFAKTCIEMIEI